LVAFVRQLFTVLLVILITMIGTSALVLAVVVVLGESMRVRRRIRIHRRRGRQPSR
jgi:hypothetical protein